MSIIQSTGRGPRVHSAPPTILGNYRLRELIGSGRWCDVFRAGSVHQTDDTFDYAIKMPRAELSRDLFTKSRLQRESFVGSQISDPHIVPVLDAQIENNQPYIVLPFLDGKNAADLLRSTTTLSTSQALWTVRQATQGLVALHTAGWIHGDLKPANLIVSPIGHVTICDLGFARKVTGEFQVASDPHTVLATPRYAAPEIYCSSFQESFASDIYSLGVVLFELLTGTHPLGQLADEEYVVAHRQVQALDPRQFDPLITREIRYLLMQMLSKEPLRRPTTERLVERLIDLEIATFDDRAIA